MCCRRIEAHLGSETQRAGLTTLQAVGQICDGYVEYRTSAETLDTQYFYRAELPLSLRTSDLVYDLEVELRPRPGSAMHQLLASAVVEFVNEAGDLIDMARVGANHKATVLTSGFPALLAPFSKLAVRISVELASDDLDIERIYCKATWRTVWLSDAQRLALANSHVAITCMPVTPERDNFVCFGLGMASVHLSGGLVSDRRQPSGTLLCARSLEEHLLLAYNSQEPRELLPHALACPDCCTRTLAELTRLLQTEMALSPDEERLILSKQ